MKDKNRPTRRKTPQIKDRVLQARIPEQLDDELRDRADQLGLSVSTIVRNVLLHTFELVEGVVIDSSQVARALTGRGASAPAPARDADAAIVGWQEVILNKNGICEECNAILPVGKRAVIGVPTGPRPLLMCMECVAALPTSCGDTSTETPAAAATKKSKRRAPKRTSAGSKKKIE